MLLSAKKRTFLISAALGIAVACGLAMSAPPAELPRQATGIWLAEDLAADDLLAVDAPDSGGKLYLRRPMIIAPADIDDASVRIDDHNRPVIAVRLTASGAKKMSAATSEHTGKRLAFLVQGQVVCAPKIVARVAGAAQVTGNFTVTEAMRIAQALAPQGAYSDPSDATPDHKFVSLFNGRDLTGWVNVNTAPDTWQVRDGLLVCSGKPTGVMRSARQYENFILHIEWRHMKPGGNSGVFVWSEGAVPPGRSLPKGMEVQMLELDWVNQHRKSDGSPQDLGYITGELFGAGGMTATPDHPRGRRSKSVELRCRGAGQWNTYDVVCVDGTVKLSINGRFVNSIRDASVRRGYLCLESEGSEIHFRNIRIMELPPGITTPEQRAAVVR